MKTKMYSDDTDSNSIKNNNEQIMNTRNDTIKTIENSIKGFSTSSNNYRT